MTNGHLYLRLPAHVRLSKPIRVHSLQICHDLTLKNTHKYISTELPWKPAWKLICIDPTVLSMKQTCQILLLHVDNIYTVHDNMLKLD